jgi:sialidase-1
MPSQNLSLRRFLYRAGIAGIASAFATRARAQSAPKIKILETRVISHEPQYYCGWPTLTRRQSGELYVVWSGGREGHICPFGRVEMMVSRDDGATWQWPQVLIDGPSDDRDAGVMETARGTLLVTTFTSLAYEPGLIAALKKEAGSSGAWPADRLNRWQLAHNRLTAEQREKELGEWMIRSTDGGITWSARYPTIVNSPHGPIQLTDGRLLYAGKELWTKEKRVGVCESTDDGQTWKWLAEIPTRPTDSKIAYHELHAVETADNRVIAHIRNENKTDYGETLQSESTDGGKTWSVPHTIGVWGLPSFLTRLRDGRLLMSYGHRRAPLGNQARVSQDHGRTWSESLIISGDGAKGDLGYPSTVELADGSLLTVWYEQLSESKQAVLRQTRWRLE